VNYDLKQTFIYIVMSLELAWFPSCVSLWLTMEV